MIYKNTAEGDGDGDGGAERDMCVDMTDIPMVFLLRHHYNPPAPHFRTFHSRYCLRSAFAL